MKIMADAFLVVINIFRYLFDKSLGTSGRLFSRNRLRSNIEANLTYNSGNRTA